MRILISALGFALLPLASSASPPTTHVVTVLEDCPSCVGARDAEGVGFEASDGRLAFFVDWELAGGRLAMLELSGIGPVAGEGIGVVYTEIEGGRIVFTGEAVEVSSSIHRVTSEGSALAGTLSLDVVSAGGERRVFRAITIRALEPVPAPSSGGSQTTVVVATGTHYHHGGCGGASYEGGGCEGDSYDGGGCEGDTAGDTGCDGASGGGGSGGCEGDTAADAACTTHRARSSGVVPSMLRLLWPIALAGLWNRRARRRG